MNLKQVKQLVLSEETAQKEDEYEFSQNVYNDLANDAAMLAKHVSIYLLQNREKLLHVLSKELTLDEYIYDIKGRYHPNITERLKSIVNAPVFSLNEDGSVSIHHIILNMIASFANKPDNNMNWKIYCSGSNYSGDYAGFDIKNSTEVSILKLLKITRLANHFIEVFNQTLIDCFASREFASAFTLKRGLICNPLTSSIIFKIDEDEEIVPDSISNTIISRAAKLEQPDLIGEFGKVILRWYKI